MRVLPTGAYDPKLANNRKMISFTVYGSPGEQPAIGSVNSSGASGTVAGHPVYALLARAGARQKRRNAPLKRIQVAILNLSQPGQCSWVKSSAVQFTAPRPTTACDAPVWLPATGLSHWALRLANPLPFGKYVFLARALDTAGDISGTFSLSKRTAATLTLP